MLGQDHSGLFLRDQLLQPPQLKQIVNIVETVTQSEQILNMCIYKHSWEQISQEVIP